MKIANQRQAIAWHFGCDINDVEWYQPTRYSTVKVMASGEDYYCALSGTKKAPPGFVWREKPDSMLNERGWRIMVANMEEEAQ